MGYGVSQLAIIPMRSDPVERSEMVSQLLFGDTYQIIEWQDKWVKIITTHDAYEGWVSRPQVSAILDDEYFILQQSRPQLTRQAVTIAIKSSDGSQLLLPAGCSLPNYNDGKCGVSQEDYAVQSVVTEENDLLVTAKSYLNSPYLWGGRTHFGIDCSGFSQIVLKQYGLNIKRDASQQIEQGVPVDDLQRVEPGDLAFFDNDEGRIVHVGIMLNIEQIIHASGKVRIDHIDKQGIFAEEQQRYTHRLKAIRRLI